MMKKKILPILILLLSSTLVSCDGASSDTETAIDSNQTTIQQSIPETIDYKKILRAYKNLTCFSIEEETIGTKKDGTSVNSLRTVDVDSSKNYYNAKITTSGNTGYVLRDNTDFYYKLGNSGNKVYYSETNDAFKGIGISNVFNLDYTYKNGSYNKLITDALTLEGFNDLFCNVNLDLETSYAYNSKGFLNVSIKFDNNKIDEISFNLNYVYGSFYSNIERKLKFVDKEIEYETFDLSSKDKYKVNTAEKLDTYALEMIKEYGDSIYIKSGDFDMLIDAGQKDDGQNVNTILTTYCTDKILDCLVVTHGHSDHTGGFETGALNGIDTIGIMIDYGYIGNDASEPYREVAKEWFSADDCVNFTNGAFKKFVFSDDLYFEVLDTNQYAKRNSTIPRDADENDYSVAIKLTFKNNTYLFAGDLAGGLYEQALKPQVSNVTVYKASHHGSVTNQTNSQSFLNSLDPKICFISAAIVDSNDLTQNAHPSKGFLNRIIKAPSISKSKNVYYNGTMGTIHLTDDGINLPIVHGLGAKKGYYYNGSLVTGENDKNIFDTLFYKKY